MRPPTTLSLVMSGKVMDGSNTNREPRPHRYIGHTCCSVLERTTIDVGPSIRAQGRVWDSIVIVVEEDLHENKWSGRPLRGHRRR